MSDRINVKVSITPLETLTTENSTEVDVISSEVGAVLGGDGDSIPITDYSGTAAQQGFTNGAVSYLSASHSAGGTKLSTRNNGDFFYVKNTGHKFSSATVLGAVTTDCVLVAVRIDAWVSSTVAGWVNAVNAGQIHFIELAWLKPGQAVAFPLGANNLNISQFGSNAADLTSLHEESQSGQNAVCQIYVRSFQSSGSAASSGNAVEFLSVE
jgi:hypothetical protein